MPPTSSPLARPVTRRVLSNPPSSDGGPHHAPRPRVVEFPSQGGPQNLKNIRETLNGEDGLKRIMAVLETKGVKDTRGESERYVKAALAIIESPDPEQKQLRECSPESAVAAVVKLAVMGLVPNHDTGTAFLVAKRDNRNNGVLTMVGFPGVRGWERLLMESGEVKAIKSGAVRRQDAFEIDEGSEARVSFRRNFTPDKEKGNDIIGSYAFVRLKDGTLHVTSKQVNEDELLQLKGRMNVESRAKYMAARECMREVSRTYLYRHEALRAAIDATNQIEESKEEGASITPPVQHSEVASNKPVNVEEAGRAQSQGAVKALDGALSRVADGAQQISSERPGI